MRICPNCDEREHWWNHHYVLGVLPGYVCWKKDPEPPRKVR